VYLILSVCLCICTWRWSIVLYISKQLDRHDFWCEVYQRAQVTCTIGWGSGSTHRKGNLSGGAVLDLANFLRPLPAWVCMSIRLLMFSSSYCDTILNCSTIYFFTGNQGQSWFGFGIALLPLNPVPLTHMVRALKWGNEKSDLVFNFPVGWVTRDIWIGVECRLFRWPRLAVSIIHQSGVRASVPSFSQS